MKNVILAISVCLTLSADTFAQATKDPKAQAILKEVSAKFKATKSLSASFKVTTLDQKTKKSDSRSGSIVLKGNKYKLMLAGQEIYCDGKSAWTYLKEANEVQISGADDKTNGISPTNIFTIYENVFAFDKSKYPGIEVVDLR